MTIPASYEKADFTQVRQKLDALSSEHLEFGETLSQGFDIVRRALDQFGGQKENEGLAISFNGGKDACVVFYMLLLVLAERDQLELLKNKRIPVVYFEKEEFPEIESFMKDVSRTYGFEYLRYATSYKDGMQDLVDSHGIKGIIMGQRRGDPWTESMEAFSPSTSGWAEFTRVNPALEWRFNDVWRFLRGSGLPYCVLYDQGYTSLGELGNTAKNEALRLPDGEYRPAYELAEAHEHLERSPRTPQCGKDDSGKAASGVSGAAAIRTTVDGGSGGTTAVPKVLMHSSTWDQTVDATSVSNAYTMPQDDALSDCMGSGDDRNVRGPSSTSIESEFAANNRGENQGAQETVSVEHLEMPTQALQVVSGKDTCVQPNAQEHGMLRGWVGESLRWLPLAVALSLILVVVGTRRSGG